MISEQLLRLIIFLVLLLGFVVLWFASLGVTYWDTSRRELHGGEKFAWLALVFVLPVLGFGAYLFTRLLDLIFTPREQAGSQPPKRVTYLKRQPESIQINTTIPAVEFVKPTMLDARQIQEADSTAEKLPPACQLSIIEGPMAGRKYRLQTLPAYIGRGADVDVRLDEDLGVSRRHAELYAQDGVLRIRDLKSTHGTQVNGFSIRDKGLENGDRIEVGDSTLVVEMF
jgi:hypothetical protein